MMATLRMRVSALEDTRATNRGARDMSDAELRAYIAGSLGHLPTVSDLECLAADGRAFDSKQGEEHGRAD